MGVIKARGKRTVHFHRLPRDFFFQHLRTFPVRCIVARSQGRRGAQEEKTSRMMVDPRTRISQVGVVSCARVAYVGKSGNEGTRGYRGEIPLFYIYILIGTIERLSRDNGQDYAQESVSSVHVGVTWRDLSRCVQDPRWGYALRERISESQEKAYPLHLASVNCRRYLPLVPRVRDIVGAHLRIRRFLFSRDPCLSICSSFLRNSTELCGETFEKKRMFVPLLLIFLLVLLKNEKLQNRVDEI